MFGKAMFALFCVGLAAGLAIVDPLAELQASVTELTNKINLQANTAAIGIGTNSKVSFRQIAILRMQTQAQLNALTNAATDPTCANQVTVANTNIQTLLSNTQLCVVTDIQARKAFSTQVKALKLRAQNILTECQAAVDELKECVDAGIATIEAELTAAVAANEGSGSCLANTQLEISTAVSNAQKDLAACQV